MTSSAEDALELGRLALDREAALKPHVPAERFMLKLALRDAE